MCVWGLLGVKVRGQLAQYVMQILQFLDHMAGGYTVTGGNRSRECTIPGTTSVAHLDSGLGLNEA
jgi:hypothetical protein